MKKIRLISVMAIVVLMFCVLSGCVGSKFEDLALNVPRITVSSRSISNEGKLITATAANKNPNNPKGENKSPALKWDAVEGAACYAVVMIDTTANWLHMFMPEINSTEITEGQFTDTSKYIGPYPPKNSGVHEYRLEVFALKNKPHNLVFTIDKSLSYKDIVKALNRYDGQDGNVLARGFIVGIYSNGDNTAK